MFLPLKFNDLELKNNQIHLWHYSLADEIPKAEQLLNTEELARGARFIFPKHRRRFRTARGLLRLILGQYLNLPPQEIHFDYGKHGKPEINHPLRLCFNLSHSSDWALLAVGLEFPLGVDLERYSARPYLGISQQLFSADEIYRLEKEPRCKKPWRFFKTWACKEAFIKAIGLGLSYPTESFTVPEDAQQIIIDQTHHQAWQLLSFMPQTGFSAALCHQPQVREFSYLSIQDLTTIPFIEPYL